MPLVVPRQSGVPVLLGTRTAPAVRICCLDYTSQQPGVGMLLGEPELEFKFATFLHCHSFFSAANRRTHSRVGPTTLGSPGKSQLR